MSLIRSSSFLGLHSQMTTCEWIALQHILNELRPRRAIEVGTYCGGSLQVLAHFCKHVDAVDVDASIPEKLGKLFSNVSFHIGNSAEILPSALKTAQQAKDPVGFILLDGDHSTDGVRRDINAILRVRPQINLLVLIHDAFNPACRRGILTAGWEESPFVHEVEVDWIPGIYHEYPYDTAEARTMWGGFALALLKPEERTGPLIISESQRGLFQAVYRVSNHRTSPKALIRRIMRPLRSVMPVGR